MDQDTAQDILRLYRNGLAKRAIARKLGINVKTIRRCITAHLGQNNQPSGGSVPQEHPEGKLAPFHELIEEKVHQGLTGNRILREVRDRGYTGGRTILLDHIRKIRGPSKASRRIRQRFETGPALECQVDWSVYRLQIGGRIRSVHCFSMILCYSRRLFIQFHSDERLPTLLSAHVDGFRYHQGVARRLVYDNMATVTLGRRGKQILWNEGFLKFARHYMFEPFLCRVRDPNRKGKIENPFGFVERDFLRARTFDSWDHLDEAAERWLKDVANTRMHSTTRLVPEEAWMDEREFLTALPETTFPVYREEIRPVYEDGLISFDGTRYSVPAHLLGAARTVTVRSYPRYIEILDQVGRIVTVHTKPDVPGGMILKEEHKNPAGRNLDGSPSERDRRFLDRFPQGDKFFAGLKQRMKGLYTIHLREILRLAQVYGDDATVQAMAHAEKYGNFNAHALRRILQERFPLLAEQVPSIGTTGGILIQPEIDDVETGSFEEYEDYSRNEPEDDGETPGDGKEQS